MNADGIANVSLLRDIKSIIDESKRSLTRNINLTMIHAYWNIGKRIVEEEQNGSVKAKYGKELLKSISKELTKQYGKGFSQTNIFMMRRLYCEYPKFQTLSEKLSWSHYLILLTIKDLHVRSLSYLLFETPRLLQSGSLLEEKDKEEPYFLLNIAHAEEVEMK